MDKSGEWEGIDRLPKQVMILYFIGKKEEKRQSKKYLNG